MDYEKVSLIRLHRFSEAQLDTNDYTREKEANGHRNPYIKIKCSYLYTTIVFPRKKDQVLVSFLGPKLIDSLIAYR